MNYCPLKITSLTSSSSLLPFYTLHFSDTLHCSLRLLLPFASGLVHEVVEDVHGHGEDDGRVVLRRDAVQRLQVAELQKDEDLLYRLMILLFLMIAIKSFLNKCKNQYLPAVRRGSLQ